ncbi:hypothetical protein MTR67_018462 [Solanum verrucosum]|uniref:Uncharacterized protein n=1 Tax=Solanum verrucosum TaxID=315347 RepID=A0AAF0QJQ8_SOLVR|nr:hypothetical protein MTR67_018462 [Solanum verrucosum]
MRRLCFGVAWIASLFQVFGGTLGSLQAWPQGLASHETKESSRTPSRTVVKTTGREGGREPLGSSLPRNWKLVAILDAVLGESSFTFRPRGDIHGGFVLETLKACVQYAFLCTCFLVFLLGLGPNRVVDYSFHGGLCLENFEGKIEGFLNRDTLPFLFFHRCHDPSLGPRRDMANEEPEGTPNKPLKLVITLHRSRKYIQH